MEAVCDWDALLLAHNGGALKEYINSTYESCETKNAAVAFCNGIIQSCPSISAAQYPIGLRLSTLRWMFVAMPKLLYSHLHVPSQTVQWLAGCANSDSPPALRGAALLVIALMMKSNISSVAATAPAAVARNLLDVQQLACDSSSATSPIRTQDILLHQCAEVLTLCDPKSPSCSSLLSVGCLRAAVSILIGAAADITPTQTRLDACKVFICISEISKHSSTPADVSSEEMFSVSASIVRIIASSSLLHDCWHIGYESALRLTNAIGAWNADSVNCLVNDVVNELIIVRSKDVLTVLDIRRVECFVGLLSAIFDECALSPIADSTTVATRSIEQIGPSMQALKTSLRGVGAAAKDMRTAASEARKGFIAMAHSIYTACPAIISASTEQFWEVSLKLLNTPLLFSCAYVACSNDNAFVRRIIENVSQGLAQVQRYSFTAACDLITSCEELCRSNCIAVLDCSDAIMEALEKLPKLSDGKAHNKEKYEWRVNVLELLRAVFGLANSVAVPLSSYVANKMVSICCRDIILLRICLGSNSSDLQEVPSAAEKQRRAAAADAQELFGSSKPEKMVTLLHLVSVALCDLLDCSTSFETESVALLQSMLQDSARNANRSLVFEDDAVQLGADIDLVAKIVPRLASNDLALLRRAAIGLLQALSVCSSDAFLLGDTHKKMLCENLCHTTALIFKTTGDTIVVDKIEKCSSRIDNSSYKDIGKHVAACISALEKL